MARLKLPSRRLLQNLLLAVGSVVATLLVGEVAARIAGHRGLDVYVPDRDRGWVLKPGQTTATKIGHLPVRINSDEFRDEPLAKPKGVNTVRLFAIGNSDTFGWGVRGTEVCHQVLERMLNDGTKATGHSTRYEVVNAGVNAYNLDQAYHYMRRIEERYHPEGFLVAYTFNDRWNRYGSLDEEQRAGPEGRKHYTCRTTAFIPLQAAMS